MAQDTDQNTSTPFRLTDLHTMIVNTHKLRNIPIGKLMRAALLAAVDGKFALRNHRGAKLILNQHDRDTYEAFATKAEQQSPHQLLGRRGQPYCVVCSLTRRNFFLGTITMRLALYRPWKHRTALTGRR